jgi:hypothetical protein
MSRTKMEREPLQAIIGVVGRDIGPDGQPVEPAAIVIAIVEHCAGAVVGGDVPGIVMREGADIGAFGDGRELVAGWRIGIGPGRGAARSQRLRGAVADAVIAIGQRAPDAARRIEAVRSVLAVTIPQAEVDAVPGILRQSG